MLEGVVVSVCGLVESIVAVDLSVADVGVVGRVLGDVRRVRGWLDSVEVAGARRLNGLAVVSPSLFPERVVADAGGVSLVEASRGFDRARTTGLIPELGVVLEQGAVSGGHVDVVTRALRELSPVQRDRLVERGGVLAEAAVELGRDGFGRVVRGEVRRICADDGVDRLVCQRRATSLRSWVDRESGMWCVRGEFDPETGAIVDGRLRATVEMLFREVVPDTCPTDPILKQHHLRALALVGLTAGPVKAGGRGRARVDVSLLIDIDTLVRGEHDGSVIDLGLPVELPIETLRRMACEAEVIVPIIVAADRTSLYLGRGARVANRAQRRVLRAMYRGCAIPGCEGRFADCTIHHLRWYRNLGMTDIDNLLPLCHRHHHRVHEGRWNLALDAHRNLTITYPDGNIQTTGPPNARPR